MTVTLETIKFILLLMSIKKEVRPRDNIRLIPLVKM